MRKLSYAVAVLVVFLALIPGTTAHSSSHVATVATFTPPRLPEGAVFDSRGNFYTSMVLTGEIVKITPNGQVSILAQLNVDPEQGFLLGLGIDTQDNIYAALASHNALGSDAHGVWRIRPNGTKELVAAIPDDQGLPNQIAIDKVGNIYVSDSSLGVIWRITRGSNQATVWLDHAYLAPGTAGDDPCGMREVFPLPVGVNGIAFDARGNLWTANGDRGLLARVAIHPKTGRPSTPEAFVADCDLRGLDGITFDSLGNLYAALNLQNRLVRIWPDGTVETLATAADGLDFPANLVFGTTAGQQTWLYLVNLAFVSFASGQPANPSILVLDAGVPGLPIP